MRRLQREMTPEEEDSRGRRFQRINNEGNRQLEGLMHPCLHPVQLDWTVTETWLLICFICSMLDACRLLCMASGQIWSLSCRERSYIWRSYAPMDFMLQEQWCKNDGDVYLQEGVSGHGVCVVEVRMRIRQLLCGGPESDETRDRIQRAKRVQR